MLYTVVIQYLTTVSLRRFVCVLSETKSFVSSQFVVIVDLCDSSNLDIISLSFFCVMYLNKNKAYLPIPRDNPCVPSPCGLNSDCRVIDEHPVCSCIPGFLGIPPNCRAECTINAECSFDRTCINHRCLDPCPGVCGLRAMCRAVNHNAICSCMDGFNGDPFTSCLPNPIPSKSSVNGKLDGEDLNSIGRGNRLILTHW